MPKPSPERLAKHWVQQSKTAGGQSLLERYVAAQSAFSEDLLERIEQRLRSVFKGVVPDRDDIGGVIPSTTFRVWDDPSDPKEVEVRIILGKSNAVTTLVLFEGQKLSGNWPVDRAPDLIARLVASQVGEILE